MKTIVQDQEEDDLAAEEENKIINEVNILFSFLSLRVFLCSPPRPGVQNMVKPPFFETLAPELTTHKQQEEKRAVSVRRRHHARSRLAESHLSMVPR
jgi:hypothetical protein